MKIVLLGIEFFSGFVLIALVLMHAPKGEGLGGIGGQARMFGAQKGLEAGLNRVTMFFVVLFMIDAVLLSLFF